MSDAERTMHILIVFAGLYELGHGSWGFLCGQFPPITVLRKRPLTGTLALVISLADVILGALGVLYGVVGMIAPEGAFFTALTRSLPLPERGEFTLELLSGEAVDLNAALFFLQWGFLVALVTLSPSFLQQSRHKPPKPPLDDL